MKAIGSLILCLMLLAVIGSAITLVWARQESRVLFMQWNKLQSERDALNVEYGRLELQQATDAEPRVIDQEARGRLGMVNPRPQDIQLVHL
ncbi:cell division protein FtsL [Frateuria aurantia]